MTGDLLAPPSPLLLQELRGLLEHAAPIVAGTRLRWLLRRRDRLGLRARRGLRSTALRIHAECFPLGLKRTAS